MPSFRLKLSGRRFRSGQENLPPARPTSSWGPPIRRSTADSLDSLNEHLRLLKLTSVNSTEDPDAHPPTYSEAVAGQDPKVLSTEETEKGKGLETSSNPGIHSELIDPTVDEARAEEQLLEAATAFIPPPPAQSQASASTACTSGPKGNEMSQLVDPEAQLLLEPQAPFPRLANPVLIPRIAPGPTMPFTRALAPSLLTTHAITEPTFLAFIDHLNILCTPHVTIRVLEITAALLSVAPLDYSDGLAALIQAACIVTSHIVAKRRCDAFLTRVNAAFLAPRGLHARIIGTKEVRRVLCLPADDRLVAPLSQDTIDLTCQERCLAGIEERGAARLETEGLALPGRETAMLARLAAWQVRRKLHEFEKSAQRSRKRALKKMEKGKKVKSEGRGERMRVKWLGWILIENLEDWEKVEEEREKQKAEKKGKSLSFVIRKGKRETRVKEEEAEVDDTPRLQGKTEADTRQKQMPVTADGTERK